MKILYFSRGRGFGHAIPDMVIANNLSNRCASTEVIFASYGEGIKLLEQYDLPAVNLEIDISNEFTPRAMLPPIIRTINNTCPDVVISHEMFFVPQVAKSKGIYSILLTHWFFSQVFFDNKQLHPIDSMITAADMVVIMDIDKFHTAPPELASRTVFTGPVLRKYDAQSGTDLHVSKEQIEFSNEILNSRYILLCIGGRSSAYEDIIKSFINSAAKLIDNGNKYFDSAIAITPGARHKYNAYIESNKIKNVYVLDYVHEVEALMTNSVLVIGRGSYTVLCELAALGAPSLHVIAGDNEVDGFHARNFAELGTIQVFSDPNPSIDILNEKIISACEWADRHRSTIQNIGTIYKTRDAANIIAQMIVDRHRSY